MNNTQITFVFLIVYFIWILTLYSRIYDKKIKNCVMGIGVLLVFWMAIRIVRKDVEDRNLLWYLYYLPLIFIPTLYYLICAYLNRFRLFFSVLPIAISSCLVCLVLTNNLHQLVFDFGVGISGEYRYNLIYFIICFWIFALLIFSTFFLVRLKSKEKVSIRSFYPVVPIVLGIVYTVLYVKKVPAISKSNMTAFLGALFGLGIESLLYINLIPNNSNYLKHFKRSKLNIKIVDENADVFFDTMNRFDVPTQIVADIKNHEVKDEYFNLQGNNIKYNVDSISGGFAIVKKDLSELKAIEESLNNKNIELQNQQRILEKEQRVSQKIYEYKVRNQILYAYEERIAIKRNMIEKKLHSLESADDLDDIRLLLCYCKRMSSIIISSYNNEFYNSEKLKLIVDELMGVLGYKGVQGVVVSNIYSAVSNEVVSSIYEIIFEVVSRLNDCGIFVAINEKDEFNLKISVDGYFEGLYDCVKALGMKNILESEEEVLEDEVVLRFKIRKNSGSNV